MSAPGYVYFIGDGCDAVKIGMTRSAPEARMAAIQTGNHRILTLLASVRTNHPKRLEMALHRAAARHHLRGEWFTMQGVLYAALNACLIDFQISPWGTITETDAEFLCMVAGSDSDFDWTDYDWSQHDLSQAS